MDIRSKVKREDMEDARMNREYSTSDSKSGAGMFEEEEGSNSIFSNVGGGGSMFNEEDNDTLGSGSSPFGGGGSNPFGGGGGSPFNDDPFGSTPFGGGGGSSPFGGGGGSSPFGSTPWGGNSGGNDNNGQQNKPDEPKSTEDTVFEYLGKVTKGFITFIKEFVDSFKTFDSVKKLETGKNGIIFTVAFVIIGLALLLFGVSNALSFIIAGLLVGSVTVPLFMVGFDNVSKGVGIMEEPVQQQDEEEESPPFNQGVFGSGGGVFDTMEEIEDGEEEEEDEDEEREWLNEIEYEEEDTPTYEEEKDPEDVLDGVEASNMITRQFLYDKVTQVLPHKTKDFNKVKQYSESSDHFEAWDAIVQNSAELFKPNNNSEIEMPFLISASDKLFYTLLEIKRVKWLKNIDQFAKEIENICRFDSNTGEINESIYALQNTVGDSIYIKIMKGETALVSLKDTYNFVGDKVKDGKMKMPVVLGVNEEGAVVIKDFEKVNSILVTGMPRSGKTFFVQGVLGQMMAYLSPSEAEFYILDPKGATSDFKSLETPHVKKFVSEDSEIIQTLRNIIQIEAVRRTAIISNAGHINILDYNKENIDQQLPFLYVVIDEVITLAERMDKDTKDEFQALLLELVSRTPNLGIRIFMIPHIVKDNILKKSITDLIPCRISVRGDAEHIEKSTGQKGFKHKLEHVGDMAVRFDNSPVQFVHSMVLHENPKGNQSYFDFLTKLWLKLEPTSIKGSLYEKRRATRSIQGVKSGNVVNNPQGNIGIAQASVEVQGVERLPLMTERPNMNFGSFEPTQKVQTSTTTQITGAEKPAWEILEGLKDEDLLDGLLDDKGLDD